MRDDKVSTYVLRYRGDRLTEFGKELNKRIVEKGNDFSTDIIKRVTNEILSEFNGTNIVYNWWGTYVEFDVDDYAMFILKYD